MDGEWLEEFVDWTDPPPAGGDSMSDACDWDDPITAHNHCFITAIHAIHLHTRKLLVYHGEQDQRVVSLDQDADLPGGVLYTPLPFRLDANLGSERWPDLFCSGHVQLADGSIYIAGGNVDGTAEAGGLAETFRFLPPRYGPGEVAVPDDLGCPYGWDLDPGSPWSNTMPTMDHDRWYPTLTVLGTGQVLIAGGATREGPDSNSRLVELYDPDANTITPLPEFPSGVNPVPLYPLMFALPNGDVLFAGGESANNPTTTPGWVLVAPENNNGQWAWANDPIPSEVTGASAVMYEPGKIMKSGGRALDQDEYGDTPSEPPDGMLDASELRTRRAEKIDLSDVPGGVDSYQGLSFEPAASMNQGRHFHNLVLLPNGTVLAVGGNYAGNSRATDHWQNSCELGSLETDCSSGCPSSCQPYDSWPTHLQCDDGYPSITTSYECSFIRSIRCCSGRSTEASCDRAENCVWDDGTNTCSEPGSDPDRCGVAMTGATCDDGLCRKPCNPNGNQTEECPPIMPVNEQCLLESTSRFPGKCSPADNECFATRTAEIWDPTCDTWVEQEPQAYPRMYHSTALLMPNGQVLSMGNGHRDYGDWSSMTEYPQSELFSPVYAPGGDINHPTLEIVDGQTTPEDEHYLPWFDPDEPDERGSVFVSTTGSIGGFSLVRLGSTTHGFDMDQRIVRLDAEPMAIQIGDEMTWRVLAPAAVVQGHNVRSIVPPGYYMLFALSEEGTPSGAEYVLLGDDPAVSYLCEADELVLAPTWTTCGAEPIGGACAAGDEVQLSAPLPSTLDAMGVSTEGWRVFLPRTTPGSKDETQAVHAACQQICEAHFAAEPHMAAACDAPGAFTTSLVEQGAYGSVDLLLPSHESGGGGVGKVNCSLPGDCFSAFDEQLQATVARRISPAAEGLGRGEEYRVSLTGSEVLVSCGATTSTTVGLDGQAGFSHCEPDSGVCPFYLGSLDLAASPSAALTLACDDGTSQNVTLDTIALRLTQPAYGVRDGGLIQFGPGGLVVETEVQVDGRAYHMRRPNAAPLTMQGFRDEIDPDRFTVQVTVPCNSSTAQVRLQVDIEKAVTLEQPPTASLDLPSSVVCPTVVSLEGTFGDPDGDLDEVRWFVDGVPLDPSLSSVTISQTHEVSAVARDQRGAATTARSTITCIPL